MTTVSGLHLTKLNLKVNKTLSISDLIATKRRAVRQPTETTDGLNSRPLSPGARGATRCVIWRSDYGDRRTRSSPARSAAIR